MAKAYMTLITQLVIHGLFEFKQELPSSLTYYENLNTGYKGIILKKFI
jgi:hypothetical protein